MRKPLLGTSVLACSVLVAAVAIAQHASDHKVFTPDAVKWEAPPPGLPPGAQLAVLSGDPTKAGPFTMRAKFPDGYRIAPHWHPVDEHVTVLEGTLHIGFGEKFDESAGQAMPAGTFAMMKQGVRHFAWAKGATVIQIHGNGPWGISYVNPQDDPRKKAPTQE